MLSAGKLLSLLPLSVVVIQGWRQHSIREEPTAGEQRQADRDKGTLLVSTLIGLNVKL